MPNTKRLVLYSSPDKIMREHPFNAGVDAALRSLVERGASVIDASEMSDDEHYSAYSSAVTGPATRNKQRVRTVFGSHSRPGCNFGLGIPALVIQDAQGSAQEIYPHMKAGRLVTIADAVTRLGH